MEKTKYFTAWHAGALEDSVKSERPITEEAYIKLKQTGLYKFYCYDERIKSDRYILKDMENNYGLPTWLHERK